MIYRSTEMFQLRVPEEQVAGFARRGVAALVVVPDAARSTQSYEHDGRGQSKRQRVGISLHSYLGRTTHQEVTDVRRNDLSETNPEPIEFHLPDHLTGYF